MKKLLLFFSLILFSAIFAYSQTSLTLSDSTGPIANNSTVYKLGNKDADEIVTHAFVTNNSSTAIKVRVKKVETYLTAGTMNVFCWGECYSPSVYVSTDTKTINPGRTDSLDFSGHVMPSGVSGYEIIRYVFYDDNNPADSVCMNVYYSHFPLGISEAVRAILSGAYPNPAKETVSFNYSVPSGINSSVVIRNILGSIVKEAEPESLSGKITFNTQDLPDGVYFYSLVINGKSQFTKKLVVNH
ncbi:MAG: T9SS type A sorting domain-containing protein [Bacteroidota bacterium]|nr:T9SS type A sorting domain-containing protein [Bacteroidota bacterium]